MKDIYLDHNIFIETLENQELDKFLKKVKDNKNVRFLYSPAHIEEIYKVVANTNSKNENKMDILLKNISDITDNYELLPTLKDIKIKKESPLECYRRVSDFDTRNRVESDSTRRYKVDKENYKKIIIDSKSNKSISTIEFDKIWDNEVVKQTFNELNKNIKEAINGFNNSIEVILAKMIGVDRSLSHDFCFKKGNYELLKNSYNDLEYTIEILFRILNYCGYNADKSERTNISGTHDVTHAIYATKADYLISTDSRFVKKCKAVYYYLGIKTQVIHVKQDEIIKILENIS